MKLTTLIVLVALMQVSASSLAQKVTLSAKNIPLSVIFDQISSQTGYDFLYSNKILNDTRPVTIVAKNEELKDVLQKIFEGQPLDYNIENKSIIVTVKQPNLLDKIKTVLAIQTTVTGKVTDETGQPLLGVTVKVKGTQTGTVTDQKGTYTLTVPDNNTIISFSYVGYESQELSAKDISNGSVITLRATATNLREVVVNKGYYTERQELSTGDVARVTSKEIDQQPVSDPILALEGRVAGLQISQASGIPGTNSTITLRGQNFIHNNTNPFNENSILYIVDGVPFSSASLTSNFIGGGALGNPGNGLSAGMSPFNSLNSSDIEDIQVLKDADATAIYGSRGANGVMLITTKKGKPGATKIDFSIAQGIENAPNRLNLLNTQQYLQMRHEALKNDGISPDLNNGDYDLLLWDTTRYTNWQKVLIGNNAHYTNAQLSISGGNANTQFLIGGGFNRQTTVFPGDFGDKKGSVHLNLNHTSANQKLKIQFSASYVSDNSNLPQTDFTNEITLAPNSPAIYNKDGSLNWELYNGTSTWNNPLASILQKADAKANNLISNFTAAYELLPGLVIKSDFGFTHNEMNQTILYPASANAPPYDNDPSSRGLSYSTTDFKTWIIEPQITYHKKISKGTLQILLGSTFQENNQNSIAQTAFGFSSDALISNPAAASGYQFNGESNYLYHYNAVYGRVNYNWDEKYLLNLTARRDGSSRFGPGKQFGNFGAVGAGWIFSKEKIFENALSFLSFGKLRASYGTTGNDQIADYQYLSTYTPNSFTYQGVSGLIPTQLTNPYFAWEVVKKLEGGIDLGFFHDRVSLSLNYFKNNTDNQLVGYPVPQITGFSSIQANFPAKIQNTGFEFNLSTINIRTTNFSWRSSANFSAPDNKLISYPGLSTSPYKNSYVIGQSIFIRELYHSTGVNQQTGLYTFATQNSNGSPSAPQDYVITQPVTQKFFGGFQNTFSYKNLELNVFIQFVKQTGINYINTFPTPGAANFNQPTTVMNRWETPGNNSNIQQFSTSGGAAGTIYNNYYRLSNATVSDASFLRLKNVSLSYELPKKWQDKAQLKNARIFVQGQNLITITKYLGLDPETQGLSLPPLRVISLGIQVSL